MRDSTVVSEGYLSGKLLVAAPGAAGEFAGCVLAVCTHTHEGAMAIVVNRPFDGKTFDQLMVDIKVAESCDDVSVGSRSTPVLRGGPTCGQRGFVLHSSDFGSKETVTINGETAFTTTMPILKAIVDGEGPSKAVMAIGCVGWDAGVLDQELRGADWLVCDMLPEIVFDHDEKSKHAMALRAIGVDPLHLSARVGRA